MVDVKTSVLLNQLDKALHSINKPNLWSYVSLSTLITLLEANERERVVRKRKALEFLVKNARVSKEMVERILIETENALKKSGYNVRRVKIKSVSPVLTGASEVFGKTMFEIGLYFHPFLNVPYISGPTIKGAVRAGAYDLLSRGLKPEKAEAECSRIFGDKECAGLVGFTDAFPVEEGSVGNKRFLLIPDVTNPHYVKASDELKVNPNPLVHPVVAPNTKFQFYVFFREARGSARSLRILKLEESPSNLRGESFDIAWIPQMDLTLLGLVDQAVLYSFIRGVGAKTSLGYSRFEIVEYVVV